MIYRLWCLRYTVYRFASEWYTANEDCGISFIVLRVSDIQVMVFAGLDFPNFLQTRTSLARLLDRRFLIFYNYESLKEVRFVIIT
ncbi:hypothetical protein E1I69_21990 [Bacillus timonensis]|uniref:Uncharacterized protein n=1 Tax=Bacillus timonensis TaxID=1033734 RepID=A0A4S3PJF5_9BACI|nr:hypothetical protein [Bacillus timonensis]THE09557.1 hypothetical protein E1I69_21990 [Bacillus timonensis]